ELLDARTDARAIRIIAEAHRKLGNPREAETAELVAIRASTRDPHLRRATLANQQQDWEQAETLVRTYLEEFEDDLLGLTVLAEALVGLRRAIEAEEAIRRVIEKVPSFEAAQLVLS